MPYALIHAIQSAPECPTCGSPEGAPCVSRNGREQRNYIHETRRVIVKDRDHSGAALSAYPLARRYEWEPEPVYINRILAEDVHMMGSSASTSVKATSVGEN